MTLGAGLALGLFSMISSQVRLTERRLADIGVIGVPRIVKEEMYKGVRDDQQGRLTFAFATSYFWASFGSGTAYKHLLFVSIMAPDASEAEYNGYPSRLSVSYDAAKTVKSIVLGSGTLTVRKGIYIQNSLEEPAHTFLYVDRGRRLQIAWHAVSAEIDVASATEAIGKMASVVADDTRPCWALRRNA